MAHQLAQQVLPQHTSKFSRHDFTLPQLFACLVLREHQRKSYRGLEQLLRDARPWCRSIGMKRVPDHNTLCRAFATLVTYSRMNRMLDVLTKWLCQDRTRTCAIDSTLYDTHHHSRHYEQRCRHNSSSDKRIADARRAASAKRTPKLGIGVDIYSHVILSALPRIGMGSDCRDFAPLLRAARRRCAIDTVLADAGYDSHENHRLACERFGVKALIKTGAGRPSVHPPTSAYRRVMQAELAGSQAGRPYGQRAQVETVNSMMKRNLGDSLRARSNTTRRAEELLRVITHNVMIR